MIKYIKNLIELNKDLNSKEKEFDNLRNKINKTNDEKELKKCDLLCFNCHMELHEELNNNKQNYV